MNTHYPKPKPGAVSATNCDLAGLGQISLDVPMMDENTNYR